MEWLDTILGAATFAAGMATRNLLWRPKKQQGGQVCGCKHHRSYHKDGEGACSHSGWDACGCKKYIGPRTLDDLVPED